MSIDWDGYQLYDPGLSVPVNELPRKEARRAYERLMQAKSARIETLGRLLKGQQRRTGTQRRGNPGPQRLVLRSC